jgi:hypothetical protein
MLGFANTWYRRIASCVAAASSTLVVSSLASSAGAQPPDAPDDDSQIHIHLQDTRTRLEEIKSELRRMQVRLKVAGAAFEASPQADIAVSNAMSDEFVLTGLQVSLDGTPLYERDDDHGALGADLHVLSGPIAPGEHVARISIKLRGDGALFPYMRAYRFELHSTYKFSATAGHIATVCVRALERGNPLTPYVQLPAVEWSDRPFVSK